MKREKLSKELIAEKFNRMILDGFVSKILWHHGINATDNPMVKQVANDMAEWIATVDICE